MAIRIAIPVTGSAQKQTFTNTRACRSRLCQLAENLVLRQITPMTTNQSSFFPSVTENLGKVSRHMVLIAVLAAALSASIDILVWSQDGRIGLSVWIGSCFAVLVSLGAIYTIACSIIQREPSRLGLARFVLVTVLLFTPTAIAFGIVLTFKSQFSEELRAAIILTVLFGSLIAISLLPAWPMAQAISPRVLSPTAIFRATRGHRGGLILIATVLAGINRSDIIPEMKSATDAGSVVLIALGQVLIGTASVLFTASVAATAWQFALRSNAALDAGA